MGVSRSQVNIFARTTIRGGRRGRPAAFSILELVCVIAIIGVLSAIAMPRWSGATQNYRMSLAAMRLANDLTMAQARANHASTPITVTFDTSAGKYQITGIADPDRPSQAYAVSLTDDPYRVSIVSATFGSAGSPQVTFDAYGTPTAGGSIVIAAGPLQRTITVDPTSGRAIAQ